jgi:hypothetical protein
MRRFASISMLSLCGLMSLAGCPKDEPADDGGNDDTTGTSGITNVTESASNPTSNSASETNETGSQSATETADADADADATDGATEGATDGGTMGTTGNDPNNPVDCGGQIWACGDGMDNDGDTFFDLMDPECTGPCDNDEGSYQTGIPGDNMDCKQDCFFDGNSGQGDDGCIWDLKCDEANPGEFIGCEYTGGNNCENGSPNQTEDCIMFCEQYVPPGCDCFGCCTVCDDQGVCVDIFLNGDPDCNVDNLDACTMCTSQIEECGNPCIPEECEICFGETEPPEGCGENECMSDLPCMDTPDCPTDYFCYLGCCYPPPPG